MRHFMSSGASALAALMVSTAAFAAGPPDTKELIAAQQKAMAPLKAFDGVWRGPATVSMPGGKSEITQTERVGGFLGDSVKVIEGRGYGPDGVQHFNALGIISFSPQTGKYGFHSYAQGYSGDFPLEVSPAGFSWTAPAGPGATIRYVATVKDNTWVETGDRIVEGQPPQRIFEMALRRVNDTDWPAAGAVPQRQEGAR